MNSHLAALVNVMSLKNILAHGVASRLAILVWYDACDVLYRKHMQLQFRVTYHSQLTLCLVVCIDRDIDQGAGRN